MAGQYADTRLITETGSIGDAVCTDDNYKYVPTITIIGDAVCTDDDEVDEAVLHEVAACVIGDHRGSAGRVSSQPAVTQSLLTPTYPAPCSTTVPKPTPFVQN